MGRTEWAFLIGLFCTTSSTLAVELLDTRLLSAVTWYHLSFLALSLAMLGMACGAVFVFLGGERFSPMRAPAELARFATYYALSVVVTHLFALCMPVIHGSSNANLALSMLLLTGVLAAPFVLSGIVVTLALTRVPGRIGLVYAVDLMGASIGSLGVLAVLTRADPTTAAYVASALAAVGAGAFAIFARVPGGRTHLGLAALLLLAAWAQASGAFRLSLPAVKGRVLVEQEIESSYWSIHGQVVAFKPQSGPPAYWAAGSGAPLGPVDRMEMVIDGLAGTYMTRWDGDATSLDWIGWDVTAVPYHLVKGGDVAVIGVGGGRDVLSALWANSRSVVGVEINHAFLDLHERLSSFSGLTRDPRVTLVHDEARSYMTRTGQQFDLIQMSLIDTWAATGAGAFTLTENGLYTVEAFDTFLGRLRPDGLMSVSRWYSPKALSETSRLVSLATAALISDGSRRPRNHLVMLTRGRLATLIVSKSPLRPDQLATLEELAARYDFGLALTPSTASIDLLATIASSTDRAALERAVAGQGLDLSPPTDDRPYFFNMVLPGTSPPPSGSSAGAVAGNLAATRTLWAAAGSSLLALVGLVLMPLARAGRPTMALPTFLSAIAYFATIGGAFMLVQVGFLQRLGPYLGHPVYAVSIALFSMVLASGLGALVSDRVDPLRAPLWRIGPALATGVALIALRFVLPPLLESTVAEEIGVRGAVAVAAVAPVSFLLGFHFPLGLRAIRGLSDSAAPWMWGVNGAAAVVASAAAVVISMWFGISATQLVAAGLYLLLALPAFVLWRDHASRAPATP